MPPLYSPLNSSAREVRLLSLLPGKPSQPIHCKLEIVSLKANPLYEALSYVWGDSGIREEITVGGQKCHVTSNLEAALRHLRNERETRVLWVDALCINQDDLDEKSIQIPLMGDIYSGATSVVAWLGDSTPMSDFAIQWISRLQDDTHDLISASVSKLQRIEVCKLAIGCVDVFRRPYWSRMWTYQEYQLARLEPVAICGALSFRAEALERTFDLLRPRIRGLALEKQAMLQDLISSAMDMKCLKGIEREPVCEGLVGCCSTIRLANLEKIHDEILALNEPLTSGPSSATTILLQRRQTNPEDRTLYNLLYQTITRCCYDPRDRVYALHSLLPNLQLQHPADYNKPVKQVMYEATTYGMGNCRDWLVGFNLFNLHPDRLHDTDYPSWIFDFSSGTSRAGRGGIKEKWNTPTATTNMTARKIEPIINRTVLSVETKSFGTCNVLVRFSEDPDELSGQLESLLYTEKPDQDLMRNKGKERYASKELLARVLAAYAMTSLDGHTMDFEDLNRQLRENRLSGASLTLLLNSLRGKVLFTTAPGGLGVTAADVVEGDLVVGWVKPSQPAVLRPMMGGTYRMAGFACFDAETDDNGLEDAFLGYLDQQQSTRYEID